jgi:hypothetical protein
MTQQAKAGEFVKLTWNDPRKLCYKTQGNHIGFTTVGDAVQRIELATPIMEIGVALHEIQNSLRDWVLAHQNKIARVFLTLRDNRLLFLAITKSRDFDNSFEDELSDLDIKIASTSILPLSVQALPNCSEEQYCSFLNPFMVYECKLSNAHS